MTLQSLVPHEVRISRGVLSLGSDVVPMATEVLFRKTMERDVFKPTALCISHNAAHDLEVRHIRFAITNVLNDLIDGECFCERRRKLVLPLDFPKLRMGQEVLVTVYNKSLKEVYASLFFAGVYG